MLQYLWHPYIGNITRDHINAYQTILHLKNIENIHLLRLLLEYWQIADTMGTVDTDTLFASMVVPMTVYCIQRDISYTMHKSMIALNFLLVVVVVVVLNAGLYNFEYVHRHSVGL